MKQLRVFSVPRTGSWSDLTPLPKLFIVTDGSFISAWLGYALNNLGICHKLPNFIWIFCAVECNKYMKNLHPLSDGFDLICVIWLYEDKLPIFFDWFELRLLFEVRLRESRSLTYSFANILDLILEFTPNPQVLISPQKKCSVAHHYWLSSYYPLRF